MEELVPADVQNCIDSMSDNSNPLFYKSRYPPHDDGIVERYLFVLIFCNILDYI